MKMHFKLRILNTGFVFFLLSCVIFPSPSDDGNPTVDNAQTVQNFSHLYNINFNGTRNKTDLEDLGEVLEIIDCQIEGTNYPEWVNLSLRNISDRNILLLDDAYMVYNVTTVNRFGTEEKAIRSSILKAGEDFLRISESVIRPRAEFTMQIIRADVQRQYSTNGRYIFYSLPPDTFFFNLKYQVEGIDKKRTGDPGIDFFMIPGPIDFTYVIEFEVFANTDE